MSNIIALISILGGGYVGHKIFNYVNQDENDSPDKRANKILSIMSSGVIGFMLAPLLVGIKDDIMKND